MMKTFVLLSATLAGLVQSQQFQGKSTNVTYPGLSDSCQDALNTTVTCPFALNSLSQSGAILDQEGGDALCVDTCLSSLQSARSTISTACTADSDIFVESGVAYPATYFVDNYIYTYKVSCYQDSDGQFCDPLFTSWSNASWTDNETCSDCWLGVLAFQLNDPLGYDDGLAENFASLTSSCSATNYPVTSPTAAGLNSTATTVPASVTATNPPECTGSYTVAETDTCESVSQQLSVSTYSLLYSNNLDIYCQNFNASVGKDLCVPPTCETYTWQAQDTCNSVVSGLSSVTVPQFLAWNANFNSLCQNAAAFTGYEVCVGPPGGGIPDPTNTAPAVTTAAVTDAPVPTNARDNSTRHCGHWYTIADGDDCGKVSVSNYISLVDFYFLNPAIDANCTNLLLGIAYCVEPVGDIHTYPGYTSTGGPTITVPPNTFSSVNTAIPTSTNDPGFDYTSSLLPMASGTIQGCDTYQNFDGSTEGDCSYIAFAYQVSTDDLLTYNPSLSSNLSTCNLQSGYSYCVEQTNVTTLPSDNGCAPVNSSNIVSGTADDCDCFMVVQSYNSGDYGCADVEADYSISADDLTSWNTWLQGSDCDTALYANLGDEDYGRPVCVGVNASAPVGTATAPPSKTPSQTGTTKTSASMGPTQTGVVAGCQDFYTVQSGDGCYSIEQTYSISFDQFYAWNPSVGSNCENLWLGYAYCVEGPAATTTAASPTATDGPSAPTQSGIASNCDAYYTVASGDSCDRIETQFSVTFANLYSWNPAIGDNCQSLWVGYAICVGVSS